MTSVEIQTENMENFMDDTQSMFSTSSYVGTEEDKKEIENLITSEASAAESTEDLIEKELADLKEAAWASLCGRVDLDGEEEIYQLVEKDVWEDKYGQFEPYVDISDELEGDALERDTKRQFQKVEEWRGCKYNLIKNNVTDRLEKDFPGDQFWYLDCGEWGHVIVSINGCHWDASLSNGVEMTLDDINELCEQSIACLVDEVENNLEVLVQRKEKDIKKLEESKYLVETLPLIIQNTEQDIAYLKELSSKKTPATAGQIAKGLLR